jgi:hypothetical protein
MNLKILERFKQINDYISKNFDKSGILFEELTPTNLSLLNNRMKDDKDLELFLTTKAKDLPTKYHYLVQDIEEYKEYSLYDLMFWTLQGKLSGFTTGTVIPMFSMLGTNPVGFVAYIVKNNEVIEIKMFSFNPNGATVLMRDLIILLDRLVKQYNNVSWTAFEGNPANRFYQKAMEKYNGTINKDGNKITYNINI